MLEGQFFPSQAIQFQGGGLGLGKPPYAGYQANAVNFSGSSVYLSRGANLTGAIDTKKVTGVWWHNGGDNTNDDIFNWEKSGTFARLVVIRRGGGAGNIIRVRAGNNADSTWALDVDGDQAVNAASGWIPIIWSFDMSDTGKRQIVTGDTVNSLTVTSYSNENLSFSTGTEFYVGSDGTNYWVGDCADFMLWQDVYIDLSVKANRRLFVDEQGKPVHPAISTAHLGTPIIRLSNATATWHTNVGSGGGFTENGTLTDASSSPSD